MKYAEHEAFLSQPQEDGKTLRAHLTVAQRAIGRKPRQLNGPELPKHGEQLWLTFCRLSYFRSKNSIGYTEIAAYCSVTRTRLQQWEIEAIFKLDAAVSNPKDHTEAS